MVIQPAGGQVATIKAAAGQRRPVHRVHHLGGERMLDVAVEKTLAEVAEDSPTIEAVVGGGVTAAGDRTDDIHLVEQRTRPTADEDGGVAQLLQHAVGKGRRAHAAAGEGEHHEQRSGIVAGQVVVEEIAVAVVGERPVERARRAARDKGGQCQQQEQFERSHRIRRPDCGVASNWNRVRLRAVMTVQTPRSVHTAIGDAGQLGNLLLPGGQIVHAEFVQMIMTAGAGHHLHQLGGGAEEVVQLGPVHTTDSLV